MGWFNVALLSAAVMAWGHIFDKAILNNYARNPLTLPLLIGIAQIACGGGLLLVLGIPAEVTPESVLLSIIYGALLGTSANIMLRVLYSSEVSRTVPIFQTSPIFTALLAAAFLGEQINGFQWVAVSLTVLGAVLLSLRTDIGFRDVLMHRSLITLLFGALIAGSAHVAGKAAVDTQPVLFTHSLRILSFGLVLVVFNLRTASWIDVRRFVRDRSPSLLMVATNELVIGNAALILMLWALSLGPASLVAAVYSTRAFFVLMYSTLVTLVFRGALGEVAVPRVILIKFVATGMIIGGVSGMAML